MDEVAVAREMKIWCQQNGYADTVRGQDQTEAEVVKVHHRYLALSRKVAYCSIQRATERFEALAIFDF